MNNKDDNPGCFSIFFPFFKNIGSYDKEIESETLPYCLRDDFLSPAEFSFFKVLSLVIGEHFTIQSKVRLADVFFVSRPNENMRFYSKIAQKHLDFLILETQTMKPLFGIELDDASHKQKSRQKRDTFIESVFEVAGLPLLRFPVNREYSSIYISDQVAPFLKDRTEVAKPETTSDIQVEESVVPLCPKCGIPMVLRTATQGNHKGNQFYGCLNYPQCREIKPYSN